MRTIVGFALTAAFSAALASTMLYIVRPQIEAAVAGLTYIQQNWPNQ
jgi:hypothetical protein